MDLAPGLEPGQRYRCTGCGNLTRFDVESVERVRRFWHVDLSGLGTFESEDRPDVQVERVSCRWCGSSGAAIEIVQAPAGEAPGLARSSG